MTFKSNVDNWYYAVIVGVTVIVLFSVVVPMLSGHLSLLLGAAILLLSLGLPLWLLFSTQYLVDTESLYVKSGPFSWTIALTDIQSVTPSKAAWSSPALSLDRLEIRYGDRKRLLVSPKDRAAFIDAVGHGSDST